MGLSQYLKKFPFFQHDFLGLLETSSVLVLEPAVMSPLITAALVVPVEKKALMGTLKRH